MASPEVPQQRSPKTLDLKPCASSASSMSTLSSVLTEERLREHNRRPPSAASAYYRGLTNSRLYLRSLGLSPSRESVASSARSSSSSSSSSVLLTLQEWDPSWFLRSFIKKKEVGGGKLQKALSPAAASAWDPGLPAVAEAVPRGGGSGIRRPLRESEQVQVPVPVPAPVQKPAVAAPVVNVPTHQQVLPPTVSIGAEGRKEREFVWAHKYRPRHLKEFICNRDQAEELQETVNSQFFDWFSAHTSILRNLRTATD